MAGDDDGELMSQLRQGDDRALDRLMDRWQVPLQRFVYRYVHDLDEAEDIAQETFVRVYRHRDRFWTGAKFSTWIFSIALNLCRDRSRARRSRPTLPLKRGDAENSSDRTADAEVGAPDTDLLRRETVNTVRAAVMSLPEPLKTAILLFEFEGFSHGEIAAIAGCSAKAVETRLYRARQLLRAALRAQLV